MTAPNSRVLSRLLSRSVTDGGLDAQVASFSVAEVGDLLAPLPTSAAFAARTLTRKVTVTDPLATTGVRVRYPVELPPDCVRIGDLNQVIVRRGGVEIPACITALSGDLGPIWHPFNRKDGAGKYLDSAPNRGLYKLFVEVDTPQNHGGTELLTFDFYKGTRNTANDLTPLGFTWLDNGFKAQIGTDPAKVTPMGGAISHWPWQYDAPVLIQGDIPFNRSAADYAGRIKLSITNSSGAAQDYYFRLVWDMTVDQAYLVGYTNNTLADATAFGVGQFDQSGTRPKNHQWIGTVGVRLQNGVTWQPGVDALNAPGVSLIPGGANSRSDRSGATFMDDLGEHICPAVISCPTADEAVACQTMGRMKTRAQMQTWTDTDLGFSRTTLSQRFIDEDTVWKRWINMGGRHIWGNNSQYDTAAYYLNQYTQTGKAFWIQKAMSFSWWHSYYYMVNNFWFWHEWDQSTAGYFWTWMATGDPTMRSYFHKSGATYAFIACDRGTSYGIQQDGRLEAKSMDYHVFAILARENPTLHKQVGFVSETPSWVTANSYEGYISHRLSLWEANTDQGGRFPEAFNLDTRIYDDNSAVDGTGAAYHNGMPAPKGYQAGMCTKCMANYVTLAWANSADSADTTGALKSRCITWSLGVLDWFEANGYEGTRVWNGEVAPNDTTTHQGFYYTADPSTGVWFPIPARMTNTDKSSTYNYVQFGKWNATSGRIEPIVKTRWAEGTHWMPESDPDSNQPGPTFNHQPGMAGLWSFWSPVIDLAIRQNAGNSTAQQKYAKMGRWFHANALTSSHRSWGVDETNPKTGMEAYAFSAECTDAIHTVLYS